jgi:diacylglycerol kinase family enzyme
MIQNSSSSHLHVPWLVLVNLHASSGAMATNWPDLQQKLAHLLPLAQFEESHHPDDVTVLLQQALKKGIRHVLAVGGDGTAHQVVNAIMLQKQVKSTAIVFALYPGGTGNDWIKTHKIPANWKDWSSYFEQGIIRRQNLGKIIFQTNGQVATRYFMNVAGFAYDAFVVRAIANQRSSLPPRLHYFWSVLRCLFQYTPQAGQLRFNQKNVQHKFYTINLGIGKYSGGGMQFVPHAQPSGTTMALTYVPAVSRWKVILNSYRFYEGRVATFKHAVLDQTAEIEINPLAGHQLLIEADGEFLGACPATISLVPQALVFIGAKKK